MLSQAPPSPPGPLSRERARGKRCFRRQWIVALPATALLFVACAGGGSKPPATGTTSSTAQPTWTVAAAADTPTPPATVATETPGDVMAPTDVPSTSAAQVISRGPSDRDSVVFTFDAGSDTGYTAQILDTLAANDITAAFGITGRWAEQNASLLERIVSDGHELINHTYDHGSFTGYSTDAPPLTQAPSAGTSSSVLTRSCRRSLV